MVETKTVKDCYQRLNYQGNRNCLPASFPLKQVDNNAVLCGKPNNSSMGGGKVMPKKFYPSAGDSLFSNSRHTFSKDAGGGQGYHSSSEYARLRRVNAIGKSSGKGPYYHQKQDGDKYPYKLAFSSSDTTTRNRALSRVRGGGCVAPKKKGAIRNTFQSGGRSILTGTGNRQIYPDNNPKKWPNIQPCCRKGCGCNKY